MESIEMYEKLFADDNLEDLYKLYNRVDKEVEKKKGQRIFLVFLGYITACVIIVIAFVKPSNIGALLGCLLVSAFISTLFYWINFSVFSWLIRKNKEDHERKEHIALRIKLAKKRQS